MFTRDRITQDLKSRLGPIFCRKTDQTDQTDQTVVIDCSGSVFYAFEKHIVRFLACLPETTRVILFSRKAVGPTTPQEALDTIMGDPYKAGLGMDTNARGMWKALVERHPHIIEDMPDFAAWMNNTARVRRWVANFDLGPEVFDQEAADKREARNVKQYIVDHPGVAVYVKSPMSGGWADAMAVVSEREGQPDHVVVLVEHTGEEKEFHLDYVELTREARLERLIARSIEGDKMLKDLLAELKAED